ncbi:MAG: hypothetical protein GWN13_23345, partial [Phycisphaerae bacterium]|nr:hypothetical protein [Phycisphaerae bacterium]
AIIGIISISYVSFWSCSSETEQQNPNETALQTTRSCTRTGSEPSKTCTGQTTCSLTPPINVAEIESYSEEPVNIIPLDNSIKSLKHHFNSNKDKVRFVALLSPNCGWCMKGAEAIRETVLDAYPNGDISVSIVWIDMLQGDNLELAQKHAPILNDFHVTHFYDADHLLGKSIAGILGGDGEIVWDIYLFYDKNTEWNAKPPLPTTYMHQLGPVYHPWIDQKHYYCGQDL